MLNSIEKNAKTNIDAAVELAKQACTLLRGAHSLVHAESQRTYEDIDLDLATRELIRSVCDVECAIRALSDGG